MNKPTIERNERKVYFFSWTNNVLTVGDAGSLTKGLTCDFWAKVRKIFVVSSESGDQKLIDKKKETKKNALIRIN